MQTWLAPWSFGCVTVLLYRFKGSFEPLELDDAMYLAFFDRFEDKEAGDNRRTRLWIARRIFGGRSVGRRSHAR